MYTRLEKIKIFLFLALILLVALHFSKLILFFTHAEELLRSSGAYAPLLYGLLMILVILISPLPSTPLVLIAGIIFNPWLALLYTLVSATIGAVIAFLLARFFFNDVVQRKLRNNALYTKMQKNPEKIAYFVFLTRLMPQVSFDIVSYVAGITSLPLRSFIIATFFGMIPLVGLLLFFGQALRTYQTSFLFVLFTSFILYVFYFLVKNEKKHSG